MAFFTEIVEALQSIETTLSQSNETSLYLVYSTIALVFTTIVLSIITLRKSSSIQQSTHYERTRSWIVISRPKPAQVVFENGTTLNWDAYNTIPLPDRLPVKDVKISLSLTNQGFDPATNLKEVSVSSEQPITRTQLENIEKTIMPMVLIPQESQNKILTVSWERWRQLNTVPLFIGLVISYDTMKTRKISGAIYKMTKGISEIIETWAT